MCKNSSYLLIYYYYLKKRQFEDAKLMNRGVPQVCAGKMYPLEVGGPIGKGVCLFQSYIDNLVRQIFAKA